MKAAQQLVRRIRTVLDVGRPSGNEDSSSIAVEYAQRCSEANERLRTCKRYLSRGMASEAMHVAEAKPILLDLCGVLDFVGIEEWSSLCARNNWPVAESIDAASVAMLNDQYSSAMTLEPAIKSYRRAVREKDTVQCIRYLRQIRVLDAGNSNWEQDLRPFEKKRQAEIRQEYPELARSNDLAGLCSMLEELNEDWMVVPDAELLTAVQQACQVVREREATAAGVRIISAISEAFQALDYSELQKLVLEYEALRNGGFFNPDSDTALQFAEAYDWYSAETSRRDADRKFEEDLMSIRSELDKERPSDALERAWVRLVAHNRDLPGDLIQRARGGIDTYRLLLLRRKRRTIAAAAFATFVLTSCVLAAVWHRQYMKEKELRCQQLQLAFDALDLPRFKQLCDAIPQFRPVLFGNFLSRSEDIKAWTKRLDEMERAAEDRVAQFDTLRATAEALRQEEFKGDSDRAEALLAEMREIAFTEEQSAFAERFLYDWNAYNDEMMYSLLGELAQKMPSAASFQTNSLPVVASAVASMRQAVDRGLSIRGASASSYTTLASYDEEVLALEDGVSRRSERLAAMTNAPTFVGYVEVAKEYAYEFAADWQTRATAPMIRIGPDGYAAYLSALREQEQRIREDIESLSVKWFTARKALSPLAEEDRLYDLRFFVEQDVGDKVSFALGNVADFGGSSDGRIYKGMVYAPNPKQQVARFGEKIFPSASPPDVKLTLHSQMLQTFLSEMDSVPPQLAVGFLLRTIEKIASAPVCDYTPPTTLDVSLISPFLKLKLLRFFSERAVMLAGEGRYPNLDAALQDMERVDDVQADWLCVQSQSVQKIERRCASVLAKHFSSLEWLIQERTALLARAIAVERGVVWSGCVDSCNTKKVRWRGSRPKEAWVLRASASGGTRLEIALLRSGNGGFQICTPLVACEPLLSPADDSVTSEVLKRLCEELGTEDEKCFEGALPVTWPSMRSAN